MNIIQWFKNTAGKIPVSVMQMAGAGAVVAVAGFGAYNYLSSPAEDNNSFVPPASYNEEVVYVAGANGGSYGANGELQSSFKAAPSRAIELTQRQEARERRNRELSESNAYYSGMEDMNTPNVSGGANGGVGYEFGATSNLGMGSDKGAELPFQVDGANPMAGIQDMMKNQISGMQAAMSGAAGQAAQGKGASQEKAGEGAALAGAAMASVDRTLASVSHNWGQGAATGGHASGNGVNNEFAVQDSGKNAPQGGPNISAGNVDLTTGEDDPALALNGKFSNFGRDRDGVAGKGRYAGKGGEELELMRKQSADIANNKFRSANEPARVFLAGQQLSGGLKVDSGSVPTTGSGVSSGTFSDPYSGINKDQLKGKVKDIADEITDQKDLYEKDVSNLKIFFWTMVATCLVAMVAIPILKNIPVWGTIAAAIVALLAAVTIGLVIWKGIEFQTTWANNENVDYAGGWAIAGYIVGALLGAGVALSWIYSSAFFKFYSKVMSFLKTGVWPKAATTPTGPLPTAAPAINTPLPPPANLP